MLNSCYAATVSDFLSDAPERVLGVLAQHHPFAIEDLQRNAWVAEICILKVALQLASDGHIILEYPIPRMGKRADAVLLWRGTVIVLEFKVGDKHYAAHALDQVLDYALDLKNFHEQSHSKPIIPLLVATNAEPYHNLVKQHSDNVFAPLRANRNTLGDVVLQSTQAAGGPAIDPVAWLNSAYRPTPTIIEAAQALYRGHNVREITRSDAGAINLSRTADAVREIIARSKADGAKSICFVTGVPGAGKTLAGLNIANEQMHSQSEDQAVFLSGNGPLVTVLREALARDEVAKQTDRSTRWTKKDAMSKVRAFVQNVHHFRDDALRHSEAPVDRVAVFDEAQRAWTREQTAAFMKQKRGQPDFNMSEPEFLVGVMDRHAGWTVVICLVGGGQEIHTGEAGLLEWFRAIQARYPHWQVWMPQELTDDEYMEGHGPLEFVKQEQLRTDARLHLAVSVRSFRSEKVSAFVKAILDDDTETARALRRDTGDSYPIVLTRDLATARAWLRERARGTERPGLLASSGALRLRAIGLNVKAQVDVANWFLNGKDDVRSSYCLEEVATEFDVQGLELDWACVAWDADLHYANHGWQRCSFRGTRWNSIQADDRRRYLKNAYRVLLTRARQGMIILVPHGDSRDDTRKPTLYDGTFDYLKRIGLTVL